MEFQLYEIFKTIQGEGLLQGVPSVIVRLTGCNLSCKWCDTKDIISRNDYYKIGIVELLEKLKGYKCNNIIITGGEPLLEPNLDKLIKILKIEGYHVTVETNTTIKRDLECDLISMSPKLEHSVSGNNSIERINLDIIRYYIKNYNYQIKFVVRDNKNDFLEVKSILDNIGEYDPFRIMLMPQAMTNMELYRIQKNIVRLCIDYGFRYANRLQLQIWGNDKEV